MNKYGTQERILGKSETVIFKNWRISLYASGNIICNMEDGRGTSYCFVHKDQALKLIDEVSAPGWWYNNRADPRWHYIPNQNPQIPSDIKVSIELYVQNNLGLTFQEFLGIIAAGSLTTNNNEEENG